MRDVMVARAGEAARWNVLGETVSCLLADPDAGYSVVEVTVPPNAGPPVHAHQREDEGCYVLQGSFEILVNDRTFTAQAGTYVHFPRNTPHTYRNSGTEPGRLLVVIAPGGYERFFESVSARAAENGGGPDPAVLMELASRFQVSIMGPPLAARG